MIKLNNIENASGLLTFSNVPNIVEITSEEEDTQIYTYTITCTSSGVPQTFLDNIDEAYINFGEYIVRFTTDLNSAVNNVAYISQNRNEEYLNGEAYYLAKALNNSGMQNYYEITNDSNTVKISPRLGSGMLSIAAITVQLSKLGLPWEISEASTRTTRPLLENAKIQLDITLDGKKLSTLEKVYYKNSVRFDISNILKNYTEYNKIFPYTIKAYYIKNSALKPLGSLNTNYITYGYITDHSKYYINTNNKNVDYLLNKDRMYYYTHNTPISLYSIDNSNVKLLMVLYDLKGEVINWYDTTITPRNRIANTTIGFDGFNDMAYFDVYLNDEETPSLRFNNIYSIGKHKAITVHYFNEYGGEMAFPFCGGKESDNDYDLTTHKKSNFDFYSSRDKENNVTYKIEAERKITLKTHYIKEEALETLRNMMLSKKIWIIDDDGSKHYITQNDYEETEISSGVYQVSVTFIL